MNIIGIFYELKQYFKSSSTYRNIILLMLVWWLYFYTTLLIHILMDLSNENTHMMHEEKISFNLKSFVFDINTNSYV